MCCFHATFFCIYLGGFVKAATFCFCRVQMIKMRVLILVESRPEILL